MDLLFFFRMIHARHRLQTAPFITPLPIADHPAWIIRSCVLCKSFSPGHCSPVLNCGVYNSSTMGVCTGKTEQLMHLLVHEARLPVLVVNDHQWQLLRVVVTTGPLQECSISYCWLIVTIGRKIHKHQVHNRRIGLDLHPLKGMLHRHADYPSWSIFLCSQ